MDAPVERDEALQWIHNGGLIRSMTGTPGYIDVFKPSLKAMLKKADADCHDLKLRKELGEAAIVRYNTIEEILSMCDVYIENIEIGAAYLKDLDEAEAGIEQ